MANEQITFDKLPQAVGYLTEQMEQIRQMVVNAFIGMISITAIHWSMNWIFSTLM